jgi:predicted extracellular nuclease
MGVVTLEQSQAEELNVMFWNVENLLDQHDDPLLDADEPINPANVKKKLDNIGKVIANVDADIVGLCEVENHNLLRDLVANHLIQKGYKYFVLLEGKDIRGIDCAIVSKEPFLSRSFAIPNFPRGVLAGRFMIKGQPMYVLVNHWKSRRDSSGNGGDDEKQRITAAETLLAIVKREIPKYEGKEVPVIMGGDFNDTDNNKSAQVLKEGGLFNTLEPLSGADRWTHAYVNPEGDVELLGIDHIWCNQQLQKSGGIAWQQSKVMRPNMMVNERVIKGKKYDMPLDDYKDRIGFSDHFPVRATIMIDGKN